MTTVEKLDEVFSKYIRLTHSDHQGYCECYTCTLRLPWQAVDNGHFIGRGHALFRFSEDNCRPQCPSCNRNRNGMPEVFEERLRDELGDETVDEMLSMTEPEPWDEAKLKQLLIHYRDIVKRLGGVV